MIPLMTVFFFLDQGTVLGPPLWNCYFGDVQSVVREAELTETLFADDLNCYTAFPTTTASDEVKRKLQGCQTAVHRWGKANQVEFDSSKEGFYVLHRLNPTGENFRMLGVLWDTTLSMRPECEEVGKRAFAKVRSLLRLRRYYTTEQLVTQYKAHVLPVLEFPTPAVYHAANSTLEHLDRVQKHFLRELDLTAQQALEEYNLAPLNTRRDLALLGLVHRTVLGEGPPHFQQWFFLATVQEGGYLTRRRAALHSKQLHDWLGTDHTELLRRSPLGLVRVYNRLAQDVVDATSVSCFQALLQNLVKEAAGRGEDDWDLLLSPRRERWRRP